MTTSFQTETAPTAGPGSGDGKLRDSGKNFVDCFPVHLADPLLYKTVGQHDDETEEQTDSVQTHGEMQQVRGVWKIGKREKTWRESTQWRHQIETFSASLAFVMGIYRSPVNSPHKGQWRGDLMFSLICAWKTGSVTIETPVIWDAIALIMTSL